MSGMFDERFTGLHVSLDTGFDTQPVHDCLPLNQEAMARTSEALRQIGAPAFREAVLATYARLNEQDLQ
jgi:hypothetical protein